MRLIEFGVVVDTTKPNSIIRETCRNCCLRLIFRELESNRFFDGTPDLSVLSGDDHRFWPFLRRSMIVIEVTVPPRGRCSND
jgi:hypothetical protein